MKEIKLEEVFNDEKREGVKQVILEHKNSIWNSWELYLLILGERSVDYSYTPEMIFEHFDYFKNCWSDKLSTYKALEFFSYELDEKL